jgi:hypothetical protein
LDFFGVANETFPIFRYNLLVCQFLFILGIASKINSKEEILKSINTYLLGYFISLIIGYLFFIGFSAGILTLSMVDRFSIEAQQSLQNLLRFAPGTCANEYGIISSFTLSILTALFIEKDKAKITSISTMNLLLFTLLTAVALLLSTTRAAYIAYFVCFVYLIRNHPKALRIALSLFLSAFGIVCLLVAFGANMFLIFKIGFTQKIDEGSIGSRYAAWWEAL